MTKTRMLVLLLAGIAMILVILALQLLAPGDILHYEGADGARVVFSSDHGTVAAPGACVMVSWQVEHIRAVYLNDQPQIGQGNSEVCVDENAMPVLRVEFNDGTTTEYPLHIRFLFEQPATRLLVAAGVLLALACLLAALVRPSPGAPIGEGRRASRGVVIFAGIGLLITVVTITGLALELGLRFYFGQYGTLGEKSAYLYSRAEIDALQAATIPLPFVEYGLSPDYPGHNALGYRGDEIQVPKPEGTFRIVVLGDSTTYGNFNPYDETYPYLLGETLRDEIGYSNVEVINGGVTQYTSWNIFVDLALRVTALQPDLVIVYEGWNDMDAREVSPDCYSAASPFLGLDPRRLLRAQPAELSPSALYRFIAIQLGWMPNPTAEGTEYVGSTVACSAQNLANIPQNLQANPPIYFERNIRNMIAIAQANAFRIMFITWVYDETNPQPPAYRRPIVEEHNDITRRVAQENGALLFDYAAVAPTDKDFWADALHLNKEGNQYFARAIAQFLDEHGVINAGAERAPG